MRRRARSCRRARGSAFPACRPRPLRRVGPVRVVVGVGALTGEDAEEHPDVVCRPARAGRAAQPHPRDREVVAVGEGRREAGLQRERRDRGVGLALPLLVGQQRERVGAGGVRERRRAVQVAQERLEVAVGAGDAVGAEGRSAGERDVVDRRRRAEHAQVLAEVRLVVLRRVDVGEVGVARGDQLEVHRCARAAHCRTARGQAGAQVQRWRHAGAWELRQQRSRERDVVGDPNPLGRLRMRAVLELRPGRGRRDLNAVPLQGRERPAERRHLDAEVLERLLAQTVDDDPERRRDQAALVIDDVLRLVLPERVLLRVELDLRYRERIVGVGGGERRGRPGREDVLEDAEEPGERVGRVAGHRVVAAGEVARIVRDHLVDREAELDGQVVDEGERAAVAHRVAVAVDMRAADVGPGERVVHPVGAGGVGRGSTRVRRAVAVQPVLYEDLVAAGVVVVVVPVQEQLQRAVVREALAAAVAGVPFAGERHQDLGPLGHPQHRDDRPGSCDRSVVALRVDVDRIAVAVVERAAAVRLVEHHLLAVRGSELARVGAKPAGGGRERGLDLTFQEVRVRRDIRLLCGRKAGPEPVRRVEREIGGVPEAVAHDPSIRRTAERA